MARVKRRRQPGGLTMSQLRRRQALESAIRKARANKGETTMAQAFRAS